MQCASVVAASAAVAPRTKLACLLALVLARVLFKRGKGEREKAEEVS